ncbi:MFS multidrug transporter-like protein [Coniella lustricola]|uniref:MFS multidrug transporter-like protein n=1 Tax=Coniella lustricola TaxID=2025994 RepID=A0A2T3AJB5_9PEZI|nr:MFS multidrug transporter-like protein [Coniella lustricola]
MSTTDPIIPGGCQRQPTSSAAVTGQDAKDTNASFEDEKVANTDPRGEDGGTISGGEGTTTSSELEIVFTWAPARCRYDPEHPPQFGLGLNLLFALTATVTVANLYYIQPILYQIADTFNVSFEEASSVATLLQAGYATGLLLLCPLGDIFRRRPYILGLVFLTATMWLALCLTTNFSSFAGISFICGMTTVTPQLMLPLVGDLAPPHRRATCLSLVVSGLSLGMLIARLLSGVIANFTAWRNIYWYAVAAQYSIFGLLLLFLPDYPSKNPGGLNYFRMMWSIVHMYFTEPLLVQACLINFVLSAIFTSFWTTMSFLLSSPPFNYGSLEIGLFALIGIFIICWGPVYSRLVIDKIQYLYSCLLGLFIEIIGVAVGTFIGTFTVGGPVVEAMFIDLGNQACNIALRTAINDINPKARNRVNTCYMVAGFTGQLTGTAVGNHLYAVGGWRASGGCSLGFLGFAFLVCFVKGPREPGWFGWSGGWSIRKTPFAVSQAALPSEAAVTGTTSRNLEEGYGIQFTSIKQSETNGEEIKST